MPKLKASSSYVKKQEKGKKENESCTKLGVCVCTLALSEPPLHLSDKMFEPVIAGIHQLQFVLNVTLLGLGWQAKEITLTETRKLINVLIAKDI